VTIGSQPALSVVIGAHNAAATIEECLAALHAQIAPDLEIIVAESSDDGTADLIRTRFPHVRVLSFPPTWTLPRLRGEAIAVSRGDVIAVLDPFSIAQRDWSFEVLSAHGRQPHLAIGGAVEPYDPEGQGLWSWTLYINEYGLFMLPLSEGETHILAGSNVSYKRAALFDGQQRPKHDVFWKTFVNREIEASGSPLWLAPGIVVRLNKPIPFGDFFRSRYHHGRCFAAMRSHTANAGERWLRALSFPALPPLLLWRWGRAFAQKHRYLGKLAWSLPVQLLLFSSWALGECVGYSRGKGLSCGQLYY